ncbi:transposase [Anaerosacchariphilus polymeriproducens]|uniref:Transposase n=1 Tax=Anaerosacchariphilus polymeriproducens TaxID=1812858 RepID=A0A371ASW4_9FIRM|nr:transposase [Anaerosacchariphilus polymeriproducens]RDU22655.1 transposase [Anaerosacchariphilus polymeriproducens]
MNEIFIKSLYETIVKDKELYRSQLDNSNIDKVKDEYLKQVLEIYNNVSEEKKDALIDFIELVIIDTISHILGIIDGSSTLSGCDAEPKLYLDNVDTDNELQDLFLQYVEEIEE